MKTNVLSFWQSVEVLTPQDADRINASDLTAPVYGIKRDDRGLFPWQDAIHHAKPLEPGMAWVYDAQCGIYESHKLATQVVQVLSRMDLVEQSDQGGQARLFDLRFDPDGLPVAQTFALSLSAWGSGYLLRPQATVQSLLDGGHFDAKGLPEPGSEIASPRSGFVGFDTLSMALTQWVADEVERFHEGNERPDTEWLATMIELVAMHVNLHAGMFFESAFCRVRCTRQRKDLKQERAEASEGLASFYAADLRSIVAAVRRGEVGAGFKQFLGAGQGAAACERVDVRDPQSNQFLSEALAPQKMPVGRWPADHALAFSQQLAVNSVFDSLRDGSGLFAVNGPPGTGKTTLLRDVAAEVITERAATLVKLGDKAFQPKALTKLADVVAPYYPLDKALAGYSIVVATNGNGAAENVTLELPAREAVPERVSAKSRYFPELAEVVSGKKAWGLIAAPLGNRKNRTEFVSRFWWGQRKPKGDASTDFAMREHLRSLANEARKPELTWEEAVRRYKRAVALEEGCRKKVSNVASMPKRLTKLIGKEQQAQIALAQSKVARDNASGWLRNATEEHEATRAQVEEAHLLRKQAKQAQQEHSESKPGMLSMLATLGKSHARWRTEQSKLADAHHVATAWCEQMDDHASHLQAVTLQAQLKLTQLSLECTTKGIELEDCRQVRHTLEAQLEEAAADFGSGWVDVEAEAEDRERITPWGDAAWLEAREGVFLAALDVHRAFIESNPAQMGANLALACDWLSGKRVDQALIPLALESLCLVVPVISATFASFPRMFSKATQESVGWLLVDEGGQAQAAHAACAIWRARRTVMVGDPLQLEPVVTVPEGIESELARHYEVGTLWMPSWNSAQGLADQSSTLGTWLATGPGDKMWIGCPLRLHRRCAPEMFRISNEIAYGGMMVFGTNYSAQSDLPPSTWFDVKATTSDGHWVDAEGQRLQALLKELTDKGVARDQIVMISPFRDCAIRLRRIARALDLDAGKVGTVHTAQGKEAEVVVVVLGGNPRSTGAKAWAASKPNLLNVAVSRGKKRLYVIGDVEAWRQHSYFSTMAEHLPTAQPCAA